MSGYAPEPAALDPRPLLPKAPYGDGRRDDEPAVVIKTGAWDAEFFGCFDSFVNCCTVWWLPCVSIAQISQRIGWAPYWKVLQILLGVYLLEILLAFVVSFSVHTLHEVHADAVDLKAFVSDHKQLMVTGGVISLISSATTFLGSISGVVMIIMSWSLRGRVREQFHIPGSPVNDCFAAVFCSTCTVAQMATHVKSYKKGTCDIGPVDTLPGYGNPNDAKPVVV